MLLACFVWTYRSTCHRHSKCLMSPNTVFAADHPVLSAKYFNYTEYIYIYETLTVPSSVIITLTVVSGDLALMLLRNASITSLDSWSDKHHATG